MHHIKLRSFTFLICFLIIFSLNPVLAQEDEADAPYVPTPDTVTEVMLDMGRVQPGDYLIDLGSGDGRIPIMAAQRGAYAHGVEIDSSLVARSYRNAREQGVADRTSFIQGDIFKMELHQANVVTMYLFPEMMEKLKPRLLERMKPGTRIVSHLFDMKGWEPDETFTIRPDFQRYLSDIQVTDTLHELTQLININSEAPSNLFPEHDIYLWIVPAEVEGDWSWQIGDDSFQAGIQQEYQQINVDAFGDGMRYKTIESNLRGRRISFAVRRGEVRYNYSGKVQGDSIEGVIQVHRDGDSHVYPWQARKVEE